MCSGSVAIQASKATRNTGRNRRTAIASFCGLLRVNAVNQALKVDESKLRRDIAARSSRVAKLRSVDDSAMLTRDSVLHRAAE